MHRLSCGFVAALCAVALSRCFVAGYAEAGTTTKIGADFQYFSYEEPGVMEEYGMLYGLSGSLEHNAECGLLWDVFTSIVAGDLQYDGSVIRSDGTSTPLELDTPNTIFNLRGTGGFKIGTFAPYAGLGYRLLVDDLAEASSQYGYTREQGYIYMPLGVRLFSNMSSGWKIESRVEYDYFIEGRNKSHDGVLGGGVVMTQESGSGFRASVSAAPPAVNNAGFCLEGFLETWSVDDSEEVDGFYEPENDSFLLGFRFTVCFY